MLTRKLYLSLGSNLGDRMGYLNEAQAALDVFFETPPVWQSETIETEAMGFDGNAFLNRIVCYECHKLPSTVLKFCKETEKKMGRNDIPEFDGNGGRIYHNRIIDIDILLYGDIRMNTDSLSIPHPQVETRPYIKQLLGLQESKGDE